MLFKNFTLDPFQEEAVASIDKNHSVVVSAATGTGKTLIADYVIDKYIEKKRRIVYTAPIKALSNQKYRDFKNDYGEKAVGLLTGDVSINSEAQVLVMTTEIYRNMLLTKDPSIDYVDYVIFDEIHFINDVERGTIWEESIIFSPNRIRFLCLSATIPNAREFADWIKSIKEHEVDVVKYEKRAVPLEHFLFDSRLGITDARKLMEDANIPDYDDAFGRRRRRHGHKEKKERLPPPNHTNLIRDIRDKLPAIFFVFSRKECEKKASEAARKFDFLDSSQRRIITEMASDLILPEYRSLETIRNLKESLSRGVAFHHAGLLPSAKELVEVLFSKGLIKVLYATETFAVGINMPAKSVAFSSIYKYDGINFRYLNSKEYYQMAGRAGRRGIDKIGYVYVMVDRSKDDFDKVSRVISRDVEPIVSQFKLSYNTVLNMMNNYDEETRDKILVSNFYTFQVKREKATANIKNSFSNKVRALEKVGFIKDGHLTHKGIFATRIYDQEILVTELFSGDFYTKLSVEEMNVLAASIIYEYDPRDWFEQKGTKQQARDLIEKVEELDNSLFKYLNKIHIKKLYKVIGRFTSADGEFKEVIQYTTLQEGDLIRLYRRTIDLLRQIRNATDEYELRDRCTECINALEKTPVKVEF